MSRPQTFSAEQAREAFSRGLSRQEVCEAFAIPMGRLQRRLSLWAASGYEMPGDGALRSKHSEAMRRSMSDGHRRPRLVATTRCRVCHLMEPHECVRRPS